MSDLMSENVTNVLLLENLKAIQAKLTEQDRRFDRIEQRLADVEAHLSTMKADLATMVGSALHVQSDFDALARRVERIERRLDLVDLPAS